MRLSSLFASTLMLSLALAGCSGGGPTAAKFTATPLDAGQTNLQFDASTSTGKISKYEWNFGDETENATGKAIAHQFQYPNGKYNVCLTVTDSKAVTNTNCTKVQVGTGQNTDPKLYVKANMRWASAGEDVIFDATQSVDEDGDPIHFVWDFNNAREERDFKGMYNLGEQQYGRFGYFGAPPGGFSAGGGTNSTPSGGGGLLTPSGYDWQKEFEKARARADEMFANYTLHVAPPPPPEPRNEDYSCCKVDDTSPIQIFKFPAPATYFVYVKVVDVKGSSSDGYIRIKVADGRPADVIDDTKNGDLDAGSLNPAGGLGAPLTTHADWNHTLLFPANGTFTLTWEAKVPAGATSEMNGFICGGTLDFGQCSGNTKDAKKPWKAGEEWKFNVIPELFSAPPDPNFPIKIWVQNSDNSQTPVTYHLKVNFKLDVNPWFLEESGNLVFTG